jgi:DNA-binding GntR family transcriptional regulator
MVKIVRERLSNQVYLILKEMIANYRFQPGVRLNIEQLARELGTSRTPVWEAVHRLVQEGLLVNVTNRGVFIVELSPQSALELYTVREALEGLAARLAAENADGKTLKKMEKCLDEQEKIVLQKDLVGYSHLDFDFHAFIYELSDNQVLKEMLETIRGRMRTVAVHIQSILPELYEDHREIMEAIKARDPDSAETAFKEHNQRVIKHIRRSMTPDGEWVKTRPDAHEPVVKTLRIKE